MTTYNTGNPIGSTDARDLYDNAQNLDNFVNSTAASYSDRLGVSRRSLAGIDSAADNVLNGIGYAVPVAYASGISLTLTSQTVDYNGVIYAPKSSALPFTTSSWGADSVKFRAIQVTDAAYLSYTPAGAGAVPTTVQAKLRETVSVFDFMTSAQIAAVKAGTSTDDTAAIQKAIDALSDGATLDGFGLSYIVTSLNLKSNMVMHNFRLKTKAGSTDFVAPITIDGDTSAKSDIFLFNIHIDGNRQNQTSIVSPSEDGGRHGFRINGKVSNLTLSHCSAVYCGADGLHLFSSDSKPASDTYSGLCFQNIRIEHCVFDWNRRHGFSVDSANVIKFIGCDARNNGKDLDNTSPLTSGMRGARYSGNLYGRPFDFEGYGVGTAIHDVEIIGGNFTGNIAGALFYDGVDPAASGFLTRKNIRVVNAHFDISNSGLDGCFVVGAPSATPSLQVFENVEISNCRFDNWIQIYGVNGLNVNGGSVVADYAANTYYASIGKSNNWLFNIRTNKPNIVYDTLPFSMTKANVLGSPTFSSEIYRLLGFTSNGYLVRYEATLAGAIGAGYFVTFTPSSGFLARAINLSLIDNSTTKAENASVSATVNGVLNLSFDLTGTGNRAIQIVFEVVPNA